MKVHPDAVARSKMLEKIHKSTETKLQKTTKKGQKPSCGNFLKGFKKGFPGSEIFIFCLILKILPLSGPLKSLLDECPNQRNH